MVLNFTNHDFQGERELKQFNWLCIQADSFDCALQYLNSNQIKIAIAIISNSPTQKILHAINQLNDHQNGLVWIAITEETHPLDNKLTACLSRYFVDYHHQPVDWKRLNHTLGHAYGMAVLKKSLHSNLQSKNHGNGLLGNSQLIKQLKTNLSKVADSDESVLISGETGTGKGLCAHLIHSQSRRETGPFITINCGALPQSLIHSELFGHEKGAFTGADKQYIGHIERANKGTLFLDEIGDLSLESQVNLLQFLEEHIIERLGGSRNIPIDCRIIFASHVNLEAAVEEGRFREDLYYRINILHLHAPSLREHKEDIPLLASEYLELFNPESRKYTLSPKALDTMLAYEWPGNVRELKNRIHRAIIMANSEQLNAADLGIKITHIQPDVNDVVDLAQHRVEIDTELLLDAIKRNNHNISAAARELKISRTTFYRLIKKCKIKL
ncbi:sigma-54-dependent Fis family transcriptional regulator [Shewanella sp. MBTL60-112-B2]|nr:sigma-54-dependent Fis family transcriptional regulator [Shewanella sp. MBTL60-112-B1]GIU30717.1 sigma-54-dependent Fis family transcriptional regulator [Shewanella sp. MBTL60-112-B2]